MHNVFVYGTLRTIASGGREPVATHMLAGFQMYDSGKFPYIIVDPDATVYGNIITVNEKQLADLDKYENLAAGLYTREKVSVRSISDLNETTECFVYVATSELHPQKVTSGDWFRR